MKGIIFSLITFTVLLSTLISCNESGKVKVKEKDQIVTLENLFSELSFNLVKRAFIKEYNRRFNEYLSAGKEPMEILPPPMVLVLRSVP